MEEAEDFAWQPTRDPFAFVRSFSDQPPEACRGLENAACTPFPSKNLISRTNERASFPLTNYRPKRMQTN